MLYTCLMLLCCGAVHVPTSVAPGAATCVFQRALPGLRGEAGVAVALSDASLILCLHGRIRLGQGCMPKRVALHRL
jgi:hypothetical protein